MKRDAFRVVLGAGLAICLIAVPLATAATPYAPQLTRYPYLTDVVEGGATVNWATNRSSASAYVTWGAAGVESCTAHSRSATRVQITVGSTPEYQWKARLNLAPDTTYCYRVYLGPTGSGLNLLGSNPSPQFSHTASRRVRRLRSSSRCSATGAPPPPAATPTRRTCSANSPRAGRDSRSRPAISPIRAGARRTTAISYQTGANVSAVFGPAFWPVAGS